MGRAPCCDKVGLKKGPWTPEEDQILISFIQKHGHSNWRALPKQAGLLRCGKSCRLRWINYLRPDIKRGNFTKEEEDTIIQLHEIMGNRWSAIAARLPGRTDNEIKNVWHTHLKKRLEKYQTTKPQGKKARSRPNQANAENMTVSNSTATNSFVETSTGTVDNVPSSSAHSYSSNDFSSITEISSIELPNISSGHGIYDDQIFDIQQSNLDDFPVIFDETFWSSSSQDLTSDANDLNLVFSDMVDDEQLQPQFSGTGSCDCEDNVDFWLDVFVKADRTSELPEF
ncbi:hypothetical protein Cgig2_022107 [Carnegiea gigantea]|uniref:Uncharacterized protein n=1 Tax=Carnegiea gigantea TaxID=171969 RepID=A0A9Q1K131_9CARY|nr:hypothetical protein Cgig2_022107 [Carnegiea gigantea]